MNSIQANDTSFNEDTLEKAAQLSENIVQLLQLNDSNRSLRSLPQRGHLDRYLWGESSNTLPTVESTIAGSAAESTAQNTNKSSIVQSHISPAAYLMQELDKISPEGCSPCSILALEHADLFHKCTPEQMQHYDTDVVEAIYARNIETIRFWLSQGRPFQVSNSFGDTLLHIACRRGYIDVATFLVNEAAVSPWVHDEQGKTPLHCACHSAEPQFELVDFLVQCDPDLLFVADMRGSMPLDYAPKETWMDWISHLNEKKLRHVMPRREVFFKLSSQARPTTPYSALPFLDDVDRIIADYVAQRKKKKNRKHSIRESTTSSEDDGPEKIKSMMTSSILRQLHTDKDSSSSSQIIELLQEFTSLSPDVLLSNLRMHRTMDLKIGKQQRPDHQLIIEEQMPINQSTSMNPAPAIQPCHSAERIERLKQLEELQIRHIMASTALEIALDMERQASADLQKCRWDVEQARKESGALTDIIEQVEVASSSSVGTERIEHLQRLQELRIKQIKKSTATEIALEMERQVAEKLQQAELQVKEARGECDQLNSTIHLVQRELELTSPVPEICNDGDSENAIRLSGPKAAGVDTSTPRRSHDPDDHQLRPNEFSSNTSLSPDVPIDAPPRNSEDLDEDGATRSDPKASDGDSSDCCLCSHLSLLFVTAEDLKDMNYIRCHCRTSGTYDCHLQLHLPMRQPVEFESSIGPSIEACGLSPRRIGDRVWKSRNSSLSPLRQSGSRPLARRRSLGAAMGLFRMSLRDEQSVER